MGRKDINEIRVAFHRMLSKLGEERVSHRLAREVEADLTLFLSGEPLPSRGHLIEICGAFRYTSEETNHILSLAGYGELREGEATDGTEIADLQGMVLNLRQQVKGLLADHSTGLEHQIIVG